MWILIHHHSFNFSFIPISIQTSNSLLHGSAIEQPHLVLLPNLLKLRSFCINHISYSSCRFISIETSIAGTRSWSGHIDPQTIFEHFQKFHPSFWKTNCLTNGQSDELVIHSRITKTVPSLSSIFLFILQYLFLLKNQNPQ